MSFEDFVAARSGSLLRTALLLAGQNRAEAEDLLQLALERAYRHWGRVQRNGEPERYVRAILANASADRWRRAARRAERPLLASELGPTVPDRTSEVDNRDYLMRALAGLPPRQRTVLVLRYFDDLSEAETAQMLGCTVGTVKSHAARGLVRLRQAALAENRGRADTRGTAEYRGTAENRGPAESRGSTAEMRPQPRPVVAPEVGNDG